MRLPVSVWNIFTFASLMVWITESRLMPAYFQPKQTSLVNHHCSLMYMKQMTWRELYTINLINVVD